MIEVAKVVAWSIVGLLLWLVAGALLAIAFFSGRDRDEWDDIEETYGNSSSGSGGEIAGSQAGGGSKGTSTDTE